MYMPTQESTIRGCLSEQERKAVIDDVVSQLKTKGKPILHPRPAVSGYQAFFDLCHVTALTHPSAESLVYITENFGGSPIAQGEVADKRPGCYGMRQRYEGNLRGVLEVQLEGVPPPLPDGRLPLLSSGVIRTNDQEYLRDSKWLKPIAPEDHEHYDRFLRYVQAELKK